MKITIPRRRPGMRSSISALAAIGLVAGAGAIALSRTASHNHPSLRHTASTGIVITTAMNGYIGTAAPTAPPVPPPPASGGPGLYQVTGADSQGLAIQSLPQVNHVLRWVPNGTTLNVVCQVNNGGQADGRTKYGHPFTTWDMLSDGTWVYDWYMNTPEVVPDGYSPGMPHCGDSLSGVGGAASPATGEPAMDVP